MNGKNEKNVFELRIPTCAVLKKRISSPEYGLVAATMTYNGDQLTFFRTDFLSLERVAWDQNEVLDRGDFHEEIPAEILESIRKNGGFFLSKNFLSKVSNGKAVADGSNPTKHLLYGEAEQIAKSMETSELGSDIPYGAIYDTLGRWLIATKVLSEDEWTWSPESKTEQKWLLNRDCGGWNLAELLGDIFTTEWTKEKYLNQAITREGTPFSDGEANYPARKRYTYGCEYRHPNAKVRAFLYFK